MEAEAVVDVVVEARGSADLGDFLEAWGSILRRHHLIIVMAAAPMPSPLPDHLLGQQPHTLYCLDDVAKALGPDAHCKSFGFLMSRRRYVCAMDTDCAPPADGADPVEGHVSNLKRPSTPFFFNTLYDPYRKGADFVRGYPFSLREGAPTAISHGLWLNFPDLETDKPAGAPFVDATLTIPKGSLFPMSSINLAFDQKLIGPAIFLFGGLRGSTRYDSLDDIWAGLCCKVICDHLGYGIKSGLPYVYRKERKPTDAAEKKQGQQDQPGLKKQWLDQLLPFFESLRFPRTALLVQDCYLEIANQLKEGKLDPVDPFFRQVGASMEAWLRAWQARPSIA